MNNEKEYYVPHVFDRVHNNDGGYCWVDAENLSFCNELIGTVVPVNIEETPLDDEAGGCQEFCVFRLTNRI